MMSRFSRRRFEIEPGVASKLPDFQILVYNDTIGRVPRLDNTLHYLLKFEIANRPFYLDLRPGFSSRAPIRKRLNQPARTWFPRKDPVRTIDWDEKISG